MVIIPLAILLLYSIFLPGNYLSGITVLLALHREKGLSKEDVAVKIQASVIASACKIDENRKIFNEQETESKLITLLSSENLPVVISSVKAIAAMAENLSSRDKIGRLDGIPLIIPLIKNDSIEAKETSTLALANLTNSNPSNSAIVMEKNTVDLIIKLLTEENNDIQANCAMCLSNLALNETWRTDLENRGAIKGLVAALNTTDSKVQICVCQALSAFVCDVEARQQLVSENALPLLVELLKSNNESVRKNASWLVVLCAVDRTIADEITKVGGFDILQELNLSSRKSKYTEIAMERLLNSNLSAKYALTGVLNFENILDDFFYDPGKTCPGRPFLAFEELENAEINQARPVIMVNFKKIPKTTSIPVLPEPSITIVDPTINKTVSARSVEKNKTSKKDKKSKKKAHDEAATHPPLTIPKIEEPNPPQVAIEPEVTTTTQQPSTAVIDCHIPVDEDFLTCIDEVKKEITLVDSMESQIQTVALFVNQRMGGCVEKEKLSQFSYELHISELKVECTSNVIPIGKIKRGIYYHRALLFKALADSVYLPSTLVRGDYGRAWNEVKICDKDENGRPILPPRIFVVDLIHVPGELLPSGSPQAVIYQRI